MLSDLKFALRSLAKTPGFALVAIVTLALGIGANSGVLSFLNVLLFKPLPLPHVQELVFMGEYSQQVPNMSVSYPNYVDWRDRQKSFTRLGAFRGQSFNYVGASETERIGGAVFSADMFPALGVAPKLGRWFSADEDKPGAERVAVISERFWQTSLGARADVLGAKITLSGEIYSVVGVMPADFRFPTNAPDVWVPLGLNADSMAQRGSHPGLYCIGRLKPGVSLEAARADMVAVARQLEQQYPQSNTGNSVAMQSLVERAVGQQRGTVWISFAAALGVLLIACANVANLLLARAAVRSREFAVRAALGAGRGRLIRLVLTESALLGLAGTALGLLAGYGVMQGIKTLIPANSPFVSEVAMDGTVLGLSVVIGVGTTLLFGLVPALSGTRINLNEALASGGRSGSAVNARWRSVLVAGEFALTLMLLFASGLMIRTIYNLYRADLGLKTERIVSFGYVMPGRDWQDVAKRQQLLDRALAELARLPGVTQVALTNPLPLSGGGNQTSYLIEGEPEPGPGKRPSTENNAASAAYFETMRIPLLRGRTFTDQEKADDPNTIVIDAKFAETHFAGQDPIGKRVNFGMPNQPPAYATIIGVVGHVQNYGIGQDTRVQIYYPYRRTPPSSVSFVLRTAQDPASLASAIRTTMRQVEPTLPVFALRTMDEIFDASVTNERVMLRLLAIFAGIALLLAAIGLYGVLSYIVAQRTREVGVRMALGATAAAVRQLMLGQGLRLAFIGLGTGLLAAAGLGKLMSSVLYGVSPFDLLILTAVSLVLLAIGLVASWLPAHRATRINPVEALRAE
ncbi:ABC transporter permease [Oleiharenicola sp. Vm1]|uniref:ABC transporter permease n=1 Tax=Oleiharenicola sp. Vm1 TaxID=3398393 RepID=UPI0039F5BC5B